MIRSDGKNQFPGHFFSFWEWSAPILQTAEEVIQRFHELKLEGRVVKDIHAIGMGYNWTDYGIDEAVYNAMEKMSQPDRAAISNPDAFLPEGVELPCFAEIDEPLLIVFEDGDVLGITFDEGSCVRMALNTLPLTLEYGTNRKTFHANRLFRDMIGKEILGLEVTETTIFPAFTGSHGLWLEEQPGYVNTVSFVYSAGHFNKRHRLKFEAFYDYGWVELESYVGTPITISTKEVPWIVEGYEDLDAAETEKEEMKL